MNRQSLRGFTLVELLTVIAIIAILAGLLLSISGLVQTKAARSRAASEIAALSMACESYKADNGIYPRDTYTDATAVDPRNTAAIPTNSAFKSASQSLYKLLSGDSTITAGSATYPPAALLGVIQKSYYEFKPDMLSGTKVNGVLTGVNFIQDPWGNSYGYSTAGAKEEEDYLADPTKPRGTKGYNPTFDLWSSGGSLTAPPADIEKWVKNW